MDLQSRYKRCVLAMEPTTGKSAASMVCAQAIYGSRGYAIQQGTQKRKTSQNKRKTSSHRRKTSKRS